MHEARPRASTTNLPRGSFGKTIEEDGRAPRNATAIFAAAILKLP